MISGLQLFIASWYLKSIKNSLHHKNDGWDFLLRHLQKIEIGSSNNSLFLIWFHNRNLANCCSCCCSSGNSNYTSRLCVPLTTTIVVVVVNIGLQWFQRACHRRQQHCCCWCCCCCRPGQLQVLLVISFTAAMVVVMNKDITSLVRAIYNLKCCCGCILQALCVPSATSIFVVVVVYMHGSKKRGIEMNFFKVLGTIVRVWWI